MQSLRRALAVRFSLTMILALAFVLALVPVLIGQPRASQRRSGLFCVPSMNGDLGVEVPRGVGRSDPSEPQGGDREGTAERSGERICEPTNRNRIRGIVEQGERARNRKALTTKAQAV